MPAGVPVHFDQDMLFAGFEVIKRASIVKDGVPDADLMTLASRVYKAMEQARKEVVRKDLIILGEK